MPDADLARLALPRLADRHARGTRGAGRARTEGGGAVPPAAGRIELGDRRPGRARQRRAGGGGRHHAGALAGACPARRAVARPAEAAAVLLPDRRGAGVPAGAVLRAGADAVVLQRRRLHAAHPDHDAGGAGPHRGPDGGPAAADGRVAWRRRARAGRAPAGRQRSAGGTLAGGARRAGPLRKEGGRRRRRRHRRRLVVAKRRPDDVAIVGAVRGAGGAGGPAGRCAAARAWQCVPSRGCRACRAPSSPKCRSTWAWRTRSPR